MSDSEKSTYATISEAEIFTGGTANAKEHTENSSKSATEKP